MTEIWERQPDEPTKWFERFLWYRELGVNRSILSTVDHFLPDKTGRKRTDIPGFWQERIRQFMWKERALTWDNRQREILLQSLEAERKKDREERILILKATRGQLGMALKKLKPDNMKWSEVIAGIRLVSQELRTEYGDLPIQKVEVGKVGSFKQAEDLTDDELAIIIGNDKDPDEDPSGS